MDGTVFVFPDAREMAEWFCMVVGVPFLYKKMELDPLEEEIRKLTKATASHSRLLEGRSIGECSF